MFQLSRHPLSEADLAGPRDPRILSHDLWPERALDLGDDGVPTWWPNRHPETLKRLRRHDRRKWFIRFFAGEMSPSRELLLSCDWTMRRHLIAGELAFLMSNLDSGSLPAPDLS